jgi:hypothetical protein
MTLGLRTINASCSAQGPSQRAEEEYSPTPLDASKYDDPGGAFAARVGLRHRLGGRAVLAQEILRRLHRLVTPTRRLAHLLVGRRVSLGAGSGDVVDRPEIDYLAAEALYGMRRAIVGHFGVGATNDGVAHLASWSVDAIGGTQAFALGMR